MRPCWSITQHGRHRAHRKQSKHYRAVGRDRGAVEGGSRRTAVMAEELRWSCPLGSEKKGEAGMTIALVGSSGSGRQRVGACAHPWQPRGSQLAVVATPAVGAPAGDAPTPGIAGQGRAPELPPELRPHRGPLVGAA